MQQMLARHPRLQVHRFPAYVPELNSDELAWAFLKNELANGGPLNVEVWDAEDLDPWETLTWTIVPVLRFRQHRPTGTVVEAFWLTDWPTAQVGNLAIYWMAKSRWES